jgi:putative restriction endonuclease
MNGFIANTDADWLTFLSAQGPLDEVNFWQPSGGHRSFRAIAPGEPFFFRLKTPYRAIAGFGWFARHEQAIRSSLAWEAFGIKNGAPDLSTMRKRIERYRSPQSLRPGGDHEVGCLMISTPVFFPRDAWIADPSDWKPNIVEGKTYDLTVGEGRRIWEECLARASISTSATLSAESPSVDAAARYGSEILMRPRLGQGAFRVAVSAAYEGACAVTNEHSLPVLEAAHIQPYADDGSHDVGNGLLLRTDIHRLFDKGYVTVTVDHRFEVSRRLRDDYDNGRTYYSLHGAKIRLPRRPEDRPLPHLLQWHNENRFLG